MSIITMGGKLIIFITSIEIRVIVGHLMLTLVNWLYHCYRHYYPCYLHYLCRQCLYFCRILLYVVFCGCCCRHRRIVVVIGITVVVELFFRCCYCRCICYCLYFCNIITNPAIVSQKFLHLSYSHFGVRIPAFRGTPSSRSVKRDGVKRDTTLNELLRNNFIRSAGGYRLTVAYLCPGLKFRYFEGY